MLFIQVIINHTICDHFPCIIAVTKSRLITVCDLYRAEVDYNGQKHAIEVVDTGGAEWTQLYDAHIKDANVSVHVFD